MKLTSLFLVRILKKYKQNIYIKYFTNISTSSSTILWNSSKSNPINFNTNEFRMMIAPWIQIGKFEKNLMSHLSIFEIMRALFILKLCSYDFFIDRSTSVIQIYKKYGKLIEWPVRKTFFNQFVGGDTIPRMTLVVDSMHKRSLQLMFCPVLEEDIEDERSSSQFYDDNLKTLIELIELTAILEKTKPMFHLKPTAIMPAFTLEKVSEGLNHHNIYSKPDKFALLIHEMANSIENPNANNATHHLLSLNIDKEEINYFIDGLKRADILVEKGKKIPVHILVDAEFYSCKSAISLIALILMTRHNKNGHFVGNTNQGYLKEALPTIQTELNIITKQIGVNWYGKIVRGAYMDRERYLAKKRGYISPIWNTYEETNQSYNKCVEYVLEHIAQHKQCQNNHLVIAGHNEISIRLAAQKMKNLNLLPKDGLISFAQIYGMSDYLSSPLVKEGYNVYKSTPFGPIQDVLPYLARRASENRSVIKGAREERKMLRQELKTRFYLK